MTSWRSASSATAVAPRIHWENAWATGKTCSPTALRRANFPASLLASTTSSRRAASIAAARRRVVASRAQQAASSASAAATPRQRCSAAAAALVPWRVTSRPRRASWRTQACGRAALPDWVLAAAAAASVGTPARGGARRATPPARGDGWRHSAASTRRRSAGTRRELRSRLAASADCWSRRCAVCSSRRSTARCFSADAGAASAAVCAAALPASTAARCWSCASCCRHRRARRSPRRYARRGGVGMPTARRGIGRARGDARRAVAEHDTPGHRAHTGSRPARRSRRLTWLRPARAVRGHSRRAVAVRAWHVLSRRVCRASAMVPIIFATSTRARPADPVGEPSPASSRMAGRRSRAPRGRRPMASEHSTATSVSAPSDEERIVRERRSPWGAWPAVRVK